MVFLIVTKPVLPIPHEIHIVSEARNRHSGKKL